jgi:hypothetical protein
MGWYQGLGARRVYGPVMLPGTRQITPAPDPETGLVDCDWQQPSPLTTADEGDPAGWPSGIYLAKLSTVPGQRQSYIIFVVRDDRRATDLVVQLPVATYQAYNFWGGKSLYGGDSGAELPWGSSSGTPAAKVSFNRPYAGSTNPEAAYGVGAGEFLTNNQPVTRAYPISSAGWDYNMVRWLERNGYDTSYITDLDTHTSPQSLSGHRAFLSIGHDEYWSWHMRDHVEAARDAGLHLAFFGANAAYWQVRFENSPGAVASSRIMVAYKDADKDPFKSRLATIKWRSPPVSRAEDLLVGVRYVLDPVDGDMIVSDASHWVFRNTGLRDGSRLAGLLGYEVDGVSGERPATTEILAASPAVNLLDPAQTATSNMTIYRSTAGSLVFATGSMQWSWGLDDFNAPALRTPRMNPAAEQITRNVLERFGAASHPIE